MKTVEEIYQEMMAAFANVTGMEASSTSDLGVRMYAVASQIYGLYLEADWVQRQCFPQTADGTYLEYHAQLRGLERREATPAVGAVTFYGEASESDRTIGAGTVCMTASLVRFETVADGVLEAGETQVTVAVQAVEAGSGGNVAAGSVVNMAEAPVGISHCTNATGMAGGLDLEGDEALRGRVMETFARLPNGANAAFYQQSALSFEEVVAATVIPRNRGVGTVDVVIATAEGCPTEALLQQVEDYIQERREIAVDVEVLAPTEVAVPVTAAVAVRSGMDETGVRQEVSNVLTAYFNGQRLGETILMAKLGQLIYGVDGVENYTLTVPSADQVMDVDELPVLGTLTVGAMT